MTLITQQAEKKPAPRSKKCGRNTKANSQKLAALYHTRQALALTIGWLALQPQALAKSSSFRRVPFTRYSPGECESVWACRRMLAGDWFWHHIWAKPTKKRWSGVYLVVLAPLDLAADAAFFFALSSAIMRRRAISAMRMPPLSAVFSPSVRSPFT